MNISEEKTMFILNQKDMPTHWYNILPDLPEPLPPLVHPVTKQPCPLDMPLPPPLFPDAINKQEYSKESWIEIPDEVQSIYKTWRPTALHRGETAGKSAGYSGKDLLQIRGHQPGRQP